MRRKLKYITAKMNTKEVSNGGNEGQKSIGHTE